MRQVFLLIMVVLMAGCDKDPVAPEQPAPEPVPVTDKMELNRSVKFGGNTFRLDIDKDGYDDLLFGYVLVGDPLLKADKYQLIVVSSILTALAVDANEQVAVLEKNQQIPVTWNTTYEWYNATSPILLERTNYVQGQPTFAGPLFGKTRRYLPIQVFRQGKVYNGWVEISADPEQLTVNIHSAGISKTHQRAIKAGE